MLAAGGGLANNFFLKRKLLSRALFAGVDSVLGCHHLAGRRVHELGNIFGGARIVRD
jgi:hypothetical protein